jgi:hypothetical protein
MIDCDYLHRWTLSLPGGSDGTPTPRKRVTGTAYFSVQTLPFAEPLTRFISRSSD